MGIATNVLRSINSLKRHRYAQNASKMQGVFESSCVHIGANRGGVCVVTEITHVSGRHTIGVQGDYRQVEHLLCNRGTNHIGRSNCVLQLFKLIVFYITHKVCTG